ncbi:MAG: hypothetical protein WB523_05450 [Candidatus Sulfotelmatobacter sp.]
MTTTALNPAAATPQESPSNLSVVTLADKSGLTTQEAQRHEHRHLWNSRPGAWLIVSTIADIVIICTLAMRGIAMQPLPVAVVASALLAALLFAFLLDLIKVPVFRRFQIA